MAGSSWRDSPETRMAQLQHRVDASIRAARGELGLDQPARVLRTAAQRGDVLRAAAAEALPADVVDAFLRDGAIAGIRRLRERYPGLTLRQAQSMLQGQAASAPATDAPPPVRALPPPSRIPTIQPGDSGRHGWLLWPLAAFAAVLAWAWLGHA